MLLAVLVRVISLLLLARLLVRFVGGLLVGLAEPVPAEATDMVRDRVCNTFLPRQRALRVSVEGRDEYFCSTACRDRALLLLLPSP